MSKADAETGDRGRKRIPHGSLQLSAQRSSVQENMGGRYGETEGEQHFAGKDMAGLLQ